MATVKVIPPRTKRSERLRVAAYCRVSSDSADQLHSYATQIRSYTEYISQQDGWELVDIYADEGLTGTRIEQRTEFQRMMADCRRGKIDRILVKSISRFSRNTKDCLTALRELAKLGVTVKFEKENIAHHGTHGERFWFSGPAGIHFDLPKPKNELPTKNGKGRIHHLPCTIRLYPVWKRTKNRPGAS